MRRDRGREVAGAGAGCEVLEGSGEGEMTNLRKEAAWRMCRRCKKDRLVTDFHKDSSRHDGLSNRCKECVKIWCAENKQKRSEVYRKWRSENMDYLRGYGRDRLLRMKYGISDQQFEEQLQRQNGLCPLCGEKALSTQGRKGSVDHCHDTGKIRGILCGKCNAALFRIEEDHGWAMRALNYVKLGGIWGETEETHK